jgi:hypothetical protein
MNSERFTRWVFKGAGIYGILVLLPQYFIERRIGIDTPPAITHPEYFYGFVGVGLAFQVLFLAISADPVRLRPAIPAGILEKLTFAIAVGILYAQHRIYILTVFFACLDLALAGLFWVAYLRLGANSTSLKS